MDNVFYKFGYKLGSVASNKEVHTLVNYPKLSKIEDVLMINNRANTFIPEGFLEAFEEKDKNYYIFLLGFTNGNIEK